MLRDDHFYWFVTVIVLEVFSETIWFCFYLILWKRVIINEWAGGNDQILKFSTIFITYVIMVYFSLDYANIWIGMEILAENKMINNGG